MGKIPNWIRWLLFIPVSFVTLMLIYPLLKIVKILEYLFSPGGYGFIDQILDVIIYSGLTGFCFVYVGSQVAPKYQFRVSIILTTIYGFLAGIYLVSKIMLAESASSSWFQVISFIIIGIGAAIIACFQIYQKYEKKS